MTEPVDGRLQALSALVHLQGQARKAETPLELSYVMVNDIRSVLASDQAFFWQSAPKMLTQPRWYQESAP